MPHGSIKLYQQCETEKKLLLFLNTGTLLYVHFGIFYAMSWLVCILELNPLIITDNNSSFVNETYEWMEHLLLMLFLS